MRGDISKARKANRHPLDWYVEEQWCTEQVIREIGFDLELDQGLAIWDPCCGYGNIGAAFDGWDRRFRIVASDVVDNLERTGFQTKPQFFIADFLEVQQAPAPCTIFFNPPYSYRKGILEAFVRHAMKLATGRVCAIVPNKWLASQGRYFLFGRDHVPAMVLHYCQRPSMPPGDRIQQMGSRAFRGGVIDYACIVWDVQHRTMPGETRTIWLPPLGYVHADAEDEF